VHGKTRQEYVKSTCDFARTDRVYDEAGEVLRVTRQCRGKRLALLHIGADSAEHPPPDQMRKSQLKHRETLGQRNARPKERRYLAKQEGEILAACAAESVAPAPQNGGTINYPYVSDQHSLQV